MKKITFLFTLFIASYSWSQEYIPMLEEGNEWNVDVRFEVFKADPCCYTFTYDVSLGETVEINGNIYRELMSLDMVNCLLREEEGIVYKYDESSDSEQIVFDFTLEAGDSFQISESAYNYGRSCVGNGIESHTGNSSLNVASVEYLMIAGEERKVITFEEGPFFSIDSYQWIEGIGNITGIDLMEEMIDITAEHRLACFTNQGNTTFFNEATSCDNTTFSTLDNTIEAIGVYPNPVTEVSILSLPKTQQVDEVLIFNASGSLVRKEKPSADHLKIHAMNYRSGLYFYKIISEGNTLKTGKLLIK